MDTQNARLQDLQDVMQKGRKEMGRIQVPRQGKAMSGDLVALSPGPGKIDMALPDQGALWTSWNAFVTFCLMHYHVIVWSFLLSLIFLAYSGYRYPLAVLALLYGPLYLIPFQCMGGFPWKALMLRPFWRAPQRHLRVLFEREAELNPSKQYIFTWHPHGLLLLSRFAVYGGIWELMFPGIETRTLAASPLFWLPPIRDVTILLGGVDASRRYAVDAIKKGLSVALYPGGSKEIYTTDPSTPETKLVLKNRRGFVKLALENGLPLVPLYVFGEKYAYDRSYLGKSFGEFLLRSCRMPFIIFWGRWFTFMPRSDMGRLVVVSGRPFEVPRVNNPSTEVVDQYLEMYCQAVIQLFERHKHKYAREGEYVVVV